MNLYSVLLLTFAIFNGKVATFNNDKIKMIVDVIKSYSKPPAVLVRACWRASDKKNFVSEVNKVVPPKPVQFIQNIEQIDGSFRRNDLIIVADVNCIDSRTFLARAHRTNKFRSPYRWIIIVKSTRNKKEILNDWIRFNILIDSEVLISEQSGNSYSLYLPYKQLSNNSEWKIESFGTWTLEHGLNKSKQMSTALAMRRKNLGRLPVAASFVITTNYTKQALFSLKDGHIDFVTRTSFRQLDPLYEFMNATRVLVFTDTWGYMVNGSYNGMIGDITRGDAELTGTVLFITKERLKVLEFLSLPTTTTVKFVFRQPSLSYQNNLFILPLKPQVWLCILCLIILTLIIAYITAQWESTKLENIDNSDRMVLRADIGEITMMIIGALTQQGSFTELKGTLGRAVMFLLLVVFLFLYTSYSANIVALLQSSSTQIKTLTDLLNSKLEMGVEDTPYNRHLFSTATEPVKKAIYEKKIAPRGSKPNFMSLHEGVIKLQKEPFAFNMFVGAGYKLVEKYFHEHEKCGLQEIEYIEENKTWQTCRKNSPFKEIFKIGLFRNLEHGLNYRETWLMYAKKPLCIVHGGTFDSVNMTDFYPALLMLAFGMALSVVLLILEIIHSRRCTLYNAVCCNNITTYLT